MAFTLPPYLPPDFTGEAFATAPPVVFKPVEKAGVAPQGYHATSVYPEYFQFERGVWRLVEESRMDCVVVHTDDDRLLVTEFRNLAAGDRVACGRRENGEDGIFVHTEAFKMPEHVRDKFAFRAHLTRETSFSIDYDELYELLEYERKNGIILWVLGPATVFDHDSRRAFEALIEAGYVNGLLAGNALATHDLEGALYGTALGQELYGKRSLSLGHYLHLDALNVIRGIGSIEKAVAEGAVKNGVMRALIRRSVPFVLAGSIRDDGPMPEVVADVYQAQDRMRALVRRATTIICLATQLHTIATGNMTPSYRVINGRIRPVYFYTVDMSEFAVSKLSDRGSLTARSILTNVQDFVVNVERGLRKRNAG
jgi:lysine-ketoglutarate reductase/saccharopine dehydrogenase-like protein (TIGR00300 family)